MSDRIVLINQGQVEQVGAPDEVYRNPASSFVYSFLSSGQPLPSCRQRIPPWVTRAATRPPLSLISALLVTPALPRVSPHSCLRAPHAPQHLTRHQGCAS